MPIAGENGFGCIFSDLRHREIGGSRISPALCNVHGTDGRARAGVRQSYMKNAYRVLMTRARQGMVICVPGGNVQGPTRAPAYYDATFEYLQSIGLAVLD